MNWSDSEFMQFIQDFLLNYWTNQINNGNNLAKIRVETYNKYGYIADNIETELSKNVIYAIGHYSNLATSEISPMLGWTYSKLSSYINSFLDKKVMWVVHSDTACVYCMALNNKVFKIRNIPPKHPNCRCGLAAVSDDTPDVSVQYGGRKLPDNSTPNSDIILIDAKGHLFQERWYDQQGKPKLDRDYTDHGNPANHPVVPHDHQWDWSNPKPRSKWKEVTNNDQ